MPTSRPFTPSLTRLAATGAAALCAAAISSGASAQSTDRAVFVANNGNLEGSVSSFRVNADNSLTFVDKFVTGTRPNTQVFHPGTNAQSIAITPDGRYLAIGHGTSSITFEQLTLLYVNPDLTLSPAAIFQTPDSPLDLHWLSNEHLAATGGNPAGGSAVFVYQIDVEAGTRIQIDVEPTGSFNTSLDIHPSRRFLFAQDSSGRTIRSLLINPSGTLDLIEVQSTGTPFPLGIGVSPNGRWIYAGGGISDGGRRVLGFGISDVDGSLDLIPGAPFTSPGASPKQVVVSTDNLYAYVGHGTDSTVRSFSIDQSTGALTSTGFFFDVGFQGSLGEIAVMDNTLFVLDRDTIGDGVRGIYSFAIKEDGSLKQNGPLLDTTGISPWTLVTWKPAQGPTCAADLDGDGKIGSSDLAILCGSWGACADCPADLDGDGVVGSADLATLLGSWGGCAR